MTEITDLDPVDSGNTAISGESLDGAIANMGRMDNTLQAFAGMLGRSIRTAFMRIIDSTDSTKRIAFDLSGLPTATTRTLGAPYYSGTLGLVSDIRGQIYGLTLSNNVTDAANDIDIAAGSAVDNNGAASMLLVSAMGKQLDVAWAVGGTPGAPQGMRASGAAIANTTYHIFLIRRPDTGVVDIAADTSVTGANIAANTNAAYTQIRRIGSIIRTGGAILAFVQDGDDFTLSIPINDVNASNPGTSAVTRALTVPIGIRVKSNIAVFLDGTSPSTNAPNGVLITDLAIADTAPSGTAFNAYLFANTATETAIGSVMNIYTNTSGQVRSRIQTSAVGTVLRIVTHGWTDKRGQ